jgi:CheY-like chemotaxis protein
MSATSRVLFALMSRRSICRGCLARTAALTREAAAAALESLARTLEVLRPSETTCEVCGSNTDVIMLTEVMRTAVTPSAAAVSQPDRQAHEGLLAGVRIIVVDDDRDARESLQMLLRSFDAVVVAFPTARDTLRALTAAEPDVVIVDILLGRTDGLHLLRDARMQGIRAPFIAISAKAFDSLQLEGLGFSTYLRKPLDHPRLVKTVLALARGRGRLGLAPS